MDTPNNSIQIGDINQAKGIAIGDGARVEIHEAPPVPKPSSAPPLLSLVVGREDDLPNPKTQFVYRNARFGQALHYKSSQ